MITEFVGTYVCPACEKFMRNKGRLEDIARPLSMPKKPPFTQLAETTHD